MSSEGLHPGSTSCVPDGSPSFAERMNGGLLGSLVGDALGVPVEFTARNIRDRDPVLEMRAFGTWSQPAGTWSDDGALLLCTVEALRTECCDLERAGHLYVQWMRTGHWAAHDKVFDIGGTTLTALERIHSGKSVQHSGLCGEDSNGNGSLMRILPVALRFNRQVDELISRSFAFSAITHAHPRSQLSCAFYCLVAAQLLQGANKFAAYHRAILQIEPFFAAHPAERPIFGRLLSGRLANAPRSAIKSGGYVIDTLEASLWCLLRRQSFADTVSEAVNLGGDTDTTGCVTGGLAGLAYGQNGIPVNWLETLPKRELLKVLFDSFLRRCMT